MAHETAFNIPIASVSILRLIVELHRELIMLIINAMYRSLVIWYYNTFDTLRFMKRTKRQEV